jgi:hypothetical protein
MGANQNFLRELGLCPKQTQHVSILTRPRSHSYRKTIDPWNRIRKPIAEPMHKTVQTNLQPTNPPTSHDDRLAADRVKNQNTAPHHNAFCLTHILSNTTCVCQRIHRGSTARTEKTRALESEAQEQDRFPPTRILTKLGNQFS